MHTYMPVCMHTLECYLCKAYIHTYIQWNATCAKHAYDCGRNAIKQKKKKNTYMHTYIQWNATCAKHAYDGGRNAIQTTVPQWVSVYVCVCLYMCVHMCVYVYVFVYVCTHVCMCVW